MWGLSADGSGAGVPSPLKLLPPSLQSSRQRSDSASGGGRGECMSGRSEGSAKSDESEARMDTKLLASRHASASPGTCVYDVYRRLHVCVCLFVSAVPADFFDNASLNTRLCGWGVLGRHHRSLVHEAYSCDYAWQQPEIST